MDRWFGKEDVPLGDRVKWLASEQAAGRGTVTGCGTCGGSGDDPEDPSDRCPQCRGTGAVLSVRVTAAGKTPGQAAHDTWCADDDWDKLDDDERGLWEDTAWAGHAAIVEQ